MSQIMDQKLIEVAQNGEIGALYALLGNCPSILDEVDKVRFINTPLHWAVYAEKTHFVVEIAKLMRSFTRKLNQDGFSPLHLASANGHAEIVKELLKVDKDLCNLKGREKRTPLHCAAIGGHVSVLKELLLNCPTCIRDLTLWNETALHLALKHDKVEAFEELVNQVRHHWEHELLGYQDQDGNTVLHLAILKGHDEVVELLLRRSYPIVRKAVRVNVKNKAGSTAMDVVPRGGEHERVRSILRGVGAKGGIEIGNRPTDPSVIEWSFNSTLKAVLKFLNFRVDPNAPIKQRSALLAVVGLIVTATYKTGTEPPGHFEEADDESRAEILYKIVLLCNYVGFLLSIVLAFNLTTGFPFRGPLLVTLMFMVITFILSSPKIPIPGNSRADLLYYYLMTWLPVGVLIFWSLTGNWMKKIWKQLSLLIRPGRVNGEKK